MVSSIQEFLPWWQPLLVNCKPTTQPQMVDLGMRLYHRRVLPPRLDKFPFHTPQPRTGQRQSRCSGMLPIRRRTAPHSQRVGDSSSNTVVQWLSVSTRILRLQSHPAAALYDAVVRASGVVYRGVLEGGSGRVRLVNPCIRQKTDVEAGRFGCVAVIPKRALEAVHAEDASAHA